MHVLLVTGGVDVAIARVSLLNTGRDSLCVTYKRRVMADAVQKMYKRRMEPGQSCKRRRAPTPLELPVNLFN